MSQGKVFFCKGNQLYQEACKYCVINLCTVQDPNSLLRAKIFSFQKLSEYDQRVSNLKKFLVRLNWEFSPKGIPGYHFNNARAALSLSFRSYGQAAGPSFLETPFELLLDTIEAPLKQPSSMKYPLNVLVIRLKYS